MWLQHDSLVFDPDDPLNPQPGVNGVRFAARSNFMADDFGIDEDAAVAYVTPPGTRDLIGCRCGRGSETLRAAASLSGQAAIRSARVFTASS